MKPKSVLTILSLLVFVAPLFLNQVLEAGTTGKVVGVISDQETKSPLPGANIVIEGTMMGSATDLDGQFTMLNIPPGKYALKVSMMGYQDVRVENVLVRIDLTTKVDAELGQVVLESGETITIEAERPLVQLDMTSSMSAVGAADIEALPVRDIGDVLELQAGVTKSSGEIHIRGGRSGEIAYWVDGIQTTDVFSGNMGVTVENSAVQELQLVSGTFNAEYGRAMSGIVNIITKEGGAKYNGQVKVYAGDYITNEKSFQILERVDAVAQADGSTEAVGVYENPLKDFNPIYNAEFSLSGPVPFLGNKLTFFTNGRFYYDDGYLYGRQWFTPQGITGDSSIVPLSPYKRSSAQGKLTYTMNSNLKFSYNLFWNSWGNERTYSHDMKYVPDGQPERIGGGMTHIFTMNHVLSPTTFYEFKVNRLNNEFEQYVYEDPSAMPNYLIKVYTDTSLNLVEHTFDPDTEEGQAELDALKADRASYVYVIDPDGPQGYMHADSNAAPVSYSFWNMGMDMGHYKRSTTSTTARLDLTSQVTDRHQVKLGGEFTRYELELHQYTLRPGMNETGTEQIVPFVPTIPQEGSIYRHDYLREPLEAAAYLQDKIELKEIILNIGLRFDYFDANSYIPTDPNDPNIWDPIKAEHIYKNPEADPADRVEYTPEERRAFMHTKVDAKMKLSPRIGIAYPITDQGKIYFSYGHFFQIPEFQYLYDNPDFKLSNGGGYQVFGNPDLNPQKTIMYEVGLSQQITETVGLEATLFYRDVRDWVGTSPLIDTPIPSVKYSQYENKDYENVRGITLKLEKRYSNNISGRLDYTFQKAEGTYSNPRDAYNDYQDQNEPRSSLIPMAWDRNHTLNGWLSYRVNDWTLSLIGNYWTGNPYTPSFASGERVGAATSTGLRENSARLPSQKSIDLYINRMLKLSNLEFNFFVNVYNLFDQKNANSVYGDTGQTDYTTTTKPENIPYNSSRIGTIEDYVNQPGWYSAPRQVQVGFTVGF